MSCCRQNLTSVRISVTLSPILCSVFWNNIHIYADAFIQGFLHCFTLYSTDQFMHSLGIEPMTSALLAPWSTVWEEPATETQDDRPADVLINTSARVQSMQKHFWVKKLKGNCVFVSHGQTFVSQFWDINSKLLKLLVYCYFSSLFYTSNILISILEVLLTC